MRERKGGRKGGEEKEKEREGAAALLRPKLGTTRGQLLHFASVRANHQDSRAHGLQTQAPPSEGRSCKVIL